MRRIVLSSSSPSCRTKCCSLLGFGFSASCFELLTYKVGCCGFATITLENLTIHGLQLHQIQTAPESTDLYTDPLLQADLQTVRSKAPNRTNHSSQTKHTLGWNVRWQRADCLVGVGPWGFFLCYNTVLNKRQYALFRPDPRIRQYFSRVSQKAVLTF